MSIAGFDHCAITVRDIQRTIDFYRGVLGCEILWEDLWREGRLPIVSIRVGGNVINVHSADAPVAPHARPPTPGSADTLTVRIEAPTAPSEELAAELANIATERSKRWTRVRVVTELVAESG